MRTNLGIMQMATFVITPRDRDLPLFSADYLYILSNRKAYLELYDVVREKGEPFASLHDSLTHTLSNYAHLTDFEVEPAWYANLLTTAAYKQGGLNSDDAMSQMLQDSLNVYLDHAQAFPLLHSDERTEKQAIVRAYTNGLVEKGGVSTDVFKHALGAESTGRFFDQVFFGTFLP